MELKSASALNIGIIGVGRMGGAIARAFTSVEGISLMLYDKVKIPDELSEFSADIKDIVDRADIIFIAVKPKDIYDVIADISPGVGMKLVVSVAAGVNSSVLKKYIRRWARVMPNIPVEVGEGVFAIFAEKREDAELLSELLKNFGKTFIVNSDEEIDIFTATSASGPGFLSVIFEAFEDALVRAGLSRAVAREVSAQTFLGTAKMILEGKSPSNIKEEVMTPAGTTAEALVEISPSREFIFRAVEKALKKCKEISEKFK